MSLFTKELHHLRWRFLTMLLIMLASAYLVLTGYHTLMPLIDLQAMEEALRSSSLLREFMDPQEISQQVSRMVRDINFYIWSQWFGKNLYQILQLTIIVLAFPLFAGESSRGTIHFLLSAQTRTRIFYTKAAACGAAIWVIATIGCLLPWLLASRYGYQFTARDFLSYWLVITLCSFLLYGLVVFWSILFNDVVKPILFSIATFIGIGFIPAVKGLTELDFSRYMSGADVFFTHHPPGLALAIITVLGLVVFYLCRLLFNGKEY